MNILGIDPGAAGGLCVVNDDGIVVFPMPATERDLWYLFDEGEIPNVSFAYIEKVGSMPKQGLSSTFKFGVNYGLIRGMLIASGIPFEEVTPQKWQREFGLLRKDKNESTTAKKNRHKALCQQLWPEVKWTHKTTDAALISEYGRRLRA